MEVYWNTKHGCRKSVPLSMSPQQIDVLRQFRKLGIKYLVVGGQAMRAYGIDRRTRDLDLWIARDLRNAESLASFMSRVPNAPPLQRLQEPDLKLTIGSPDSPDVELLTSVAGDLSFTDAAARSQLLMLDGRRIHVVSAEDLLAIKVATAQRMDQDAADSKLSDIDRRQAVGTADKERRDAAMLQALFGAAS